MRRRKKEENQDGETRSKQGVQTMRRNKEGETSS